MQVAATPCRHGRTAAGGEDRQQSRQRDGAICTALRRALEPAITGEINELHHDKHHATYVKGANDTVDPDRGSPG